MHVYEIRLRKDHRGVDLISEALFYESSFQRVDQLVRPLCGSERERINQTINSLIERLRSARGTAENFAS